MGNVRRTSAAFAARRDGLSERLIVGGVLAAGGGFMDIYTYILYDGVFANAQTGNVVLLGYRMMNGNFKGALYSLIPIIAYVAGIFVAGICRRRIPSGKSCIGDNCSLWWRL